MKRIIALTLGALLLCALLMACDKNLTEDESVENSDISSEESSVNESFTLNGAILDEEMKNFSS